jgi:hypothetical protein
VTMRMRGSADAEAGSYTILYTITDLPAIPRTGRLEGAWFG